MTVTWTRGVDESGAATAKPAVPAAVVAKVRKCWDDFESGLRTSLSKAIALGKALLELKERCPHGEFGRHFSDHKEPNVDALPFNRRWAQKLMTMAENHVIANASHATHLPADLEAIYELATMTAPALEAAIEEGKVTPTTTRAEAKELKREADPEPDRKSRAKVERDPVSVVIDTFAKWEDWLIAFLDEHPEQRARARSLAKSLLRHTGGES